MNKIQFLKTSDRVIGKLLVSVLSRLPRDNEKPPADIRRVLIVRPGGIGDAVLLLPAIRVLKREFQHCRVDVLCEKRNAGIFGLSKEISRAYLYDRGSDLFACLKNGYDAVIDTEQWHRLSAVVAWMTGAPVRIGFSTNERSQLFTHKILYSHDDYEVYSFFHLLKPLIDTIPDFAPGEAFIDVPEGDGQIGSSDFFSGDERIIALFPGASVPERRWGGERFGEVARRLTEKGYRVLILGTDAERPDAEKIKVRSAECLDLTGRTTLRDVAALLSKSALLLTADSGLMHVATGLGTPTISLFGSGIEKKWAPRGGRKVVINRRLPCSPCTTFGYTPRCERKVECLSSITVDEIVKAVESLVEGVNKAGR